VHCLTDRGARTAARTVIVPWRDSGGFGDVVDGRQAAELEESLFSRWMCVKARAVRNGVAPLIDVTG
jgi:hypothetical protein